MPKKLLAFSVIFSLLSITSYATVTVAETILIVKPMTIMVNGKFAQIYPIKQPDGTWGFTGIKGQEFNAIVKNQTNMPITIHWHGIIDPSDQDGVPYVSQNPIPPGGDYHYHFKLLQSGTYWMHSHYGLEMQNGMFAPLIIKDPHDPYKNAKDVVMLVSDFSFKSPEQINDELTHQPNIPASSMKMNMSKPDLNDVKYDAYLINFHTAQQPEIIHVVPGQLVRLRIIDGASASSFFINLNKLAGQVIATDGEAITPVTGSIFSMSEGQRLDILVKIPPNVKQAYPNLAQAEGTHQQTGLILVTPDAMLPTIQETVAQSFGALNALQDTEFHALHPLAVKPINEKMVVTLQGNMQKYIWKMNNQIWPHITPLIVKSGDRIEIHFINQTAMAHPMHLHGHVFEVLAVNGKPITDGPLRDTVFVPANGSTTIMFDANNPGNWLLHCHVLYHGEDGMMTIMQYAGQPPVEILRMKTNLEN